MRIRILNNLFGKPLPKLKSETIAYSAEEKLRPMKQNGGQWPWWWGQLMWASQLYADYF